MLTPSIIFLMVANTIAASGSALVALQASLLEARQSREDADPGAEHFFLPSVSATSVGES
jgi:hypothetical protein